MLTTEIDVNTNYTVSVETITGYLACPDQSYQAGYQNVRNISFQYKALGVFIEATDGALYTSSTWNGSSKTANSIVVISQTYQFRIALTDNKTITKFPSGDYSSFTSFESVEAAKLDFNGKENTRLILTVNNSTTTPAGWCNSYIFPDGVTRGYLGAYGQWNIVKNNITAVDACVSACSATRITETWTSTPGPMDTVKKFYFHYGRNDGYAIDTGSDTPSFSYCRPLADYE